MWKLKFRENNKMDKELMLTIGFIINKLDITNIDIKKWDKVDVVSPKSFNSMLEPINYVREKCTGKNMDIIHLKSMGLTLDKDEQKIFKQIFTKNFKLGIGVKSF